MWTDKMEIDIQRKRMAAVLQRTRALRIPSSYGTVSEPAVLVNGGVIPIDLLARERKRVYERQGTNVRSQAKAEERQKIMER